MNAAKQLIVMAVLGACAGIFACSKSTDVKGTGGNDPAANTPQSVDPCAVIRDDGVTFVWGSAKDKVKKQNDDKDKDFWMCTYIGPEGAVWLRVSLASELEDAKIGFRGATGGMRTHPGGYRTESAIGDEAVSACATMSCEGGVQIAFRKNKFLVEMGADGYNGHKVDSETLEKLRTLARKVAGRL